MALRHYVAVLGLSIAWAANAQSSRSEQAALAKQEYAAVFAHPDDPCQWTDNYSYLQCMSKEIDFTEKHLDTFVVAMREVAANENNGEANGTHKVLDAFNKTDTSWREYRKNACSLPYAFGTGTGAAPESAECELSLDRAYMKMLAGFFNLHELAP